MICQNATVLFTTLHCMYLFSLEFRMSDMVVYVSYIPTSSGSNDPINVLIQYFGHSLPSYITCWTSMSTFHILQINNLANNKSLSRVSSYESYLSWTIAGIGVNGLSQHYISGAYPVFHGTLVVSRISLNCFLEVKTHICDDTPDLTIIGCR